MTSSPTQPARRLSGPVRSAVYEGTITHVRRGAPERRFAYDVAMPLLDLAELDEVFSLHRMSEPPPPLRRALPPGGLPRTRARTTRRSGSTSRRGPDTTAARGADRHARSREDVRLAVQPDHALLLLRRLRRVGGDARRRGGEHALARARGLCLRASGRPSRGKGHARLTLSQHGGGLPRPLRSARRGALDSLRRRAGRRDDVHGHDGPPTSGDVTSRARPDSPALPVHDGARLGCHLLAGGCPRRSPGAVLPPPGSRRATLRAPYRRQSPRLRRRAWCRPARCRHRRPGGEQPSST